MRVHVTTAVAGALLVAAGALVMLLAGVVYTDRRGVLLAGLGALGAVALTAGVLVLESAFTAGT